MSKLSNEQIAKALNLLREVNKTNSKETEIFIVTGSEHMYSKEENAIAQAAGKGDVYKLTLTEKEPVLVHSAETPVKSLKSDKPDPTWKFEELKAYAASKGIAIEATDKSKADVLAKISAVENPVS